MDKQKHMFDIIIELQAIAQSGLYYGHDQFDKERYQRLRELACDMMSMYTDMPIEKLENVFCHEVGYQTPKIDTRAAIFNDDKILLVQENDGFWSLPGGWVDINMSIKENTEKEALEEAGATVHAKKIIAIEDRDKHNQPRYLYKVIKVFVLCELESLEFIDNIETIKYGFFDKENIPSLSTPKNNLEQIYMCFDAYQDQEWQTIFD